MWKQLFRILGPKPGRKPGCAHAYVGWVKLDLSLALKIYIYKKIYNIYNLFI